MALLLQYRGFNYVSYYNGGFVDADSLSDLAKSGSNAAAMDMQYGININNSTVYRDADYTDSLTALGNTITEAVNLGLSVMVKPLMDFLQPDKIGPNGVGDWRAYFNPNHPAAFFSSYKALILAEAKVAQAHGATMMSIGTELDQLTGPTFLPYWTDIISSVRAVFSGKLTYSAIWNDAASPWQGHNGLKAGTGNIATQVSFWNQLDYVGLDVYAPLSTKQDPTLAELIDAWTHVPADADTRAVTGNQSLISYFQNVAKQIGKPLLFTEIGYESATDAAIEPAGSSTNVYDPQLQNLLYTAFFQAWEKTDNGSLKGAWFWEWDPNTSEVGPGNGANFSPQGLPTAATVKTHFTTADYGASASGVTVNLTTGAGFGPMVAGIETVLGSNHRDNLTGNSHANTFNGRADADTMAGLGGNDTYYVDNAGDVVNEAANGGSDRVLTSVSYTLKANQSIELFTTTNAAATTAINLTGNNLAQTINGNAGNNVLNGKGGSDTLTGLGGQDTFLFNTALSSDKVRITDFTHGADKIYLENAIFTKLTKTGTLDPHAFFVGAGAHDGDDHIIYNPSTGALSYDNNGNAASGSIHFATLAPHLTLTNTDFVVV